MWDLEILARRITEIGQLDDFLLYRDRDSYSFLVLGPDEDGTLKLLESGRLVGRLNEYVLEVWNTNDDSYQIYRILDTETLNEAACALADMSDDLKREFWKKDL